MKRILPLFASAVLGGSLMIGAGPALIGSSQAVATDSQTVEYVFSGQLNTFTVPNGVFSFVVSLSGASGGTADVGGGGTPGRGGFLSVTVNATPGDVYKIGVGQQGEGFAVGVTRGIPMAGGWPNGGDGYISQQGGNGIGSGAGGGGATSLFKVINGTNTLIATAGGGGGAGMTDGGGGGTTGVGTLSVAVPFDISREATGGSQSAGGQGACVDETGDSVSDFCSGDGSAGQGGDAGIGIYGGAGGGGGYFGGGSGIGDGGGAGGSSWWDSSIVTRTNDQTGVRSGNGIAQVTYTPLAPCIPGQYSANGYVPCVPAALGYFVNVSGATSQTPCPAGYTTTATGSLSCDPVATSSTSTSSTVASTTSTTLPLTVSASPTCVGKVGQTLTRSCLVKNLKVTVPSSSKVTPKISKASSKICRASATSVKALKRGTCSITLTVTPKKGKAKNYSIKVLVS